MKTPRLVPQLPLHAGMLAALPVFVALSFHSESGSAAALYYSETGFGDSVSRLTPLPPVTGATQSNLVFIRNRDPRGLAVDEVNGKVYYADGFNISRANLDGSDAETLIVVGATPGDVEVDPAGGKIYFSTVFTNPNSKIFSANLDGSDVTEVQSNALLAVTNPLEPTITTNDIFNISIDAAGGTLYWTADDGGVAGRISLNSSPLGGGAATQHWVGTSRLDSISKMDIDFDSSTLYYTVGSATNEVRSASLDNSGVTTLVSGVGRPGALALDLDNDNLYFAVGGTVYQSGLDGTALISSSISGSTLFSIADMEVGPIVIPLPGGLGLLASALAAGACARRRARRSAFG